MDSRRRRNPAEKELANLIQEQQVGDQPLQGRESAEGVRKVSTAFKPFYEKPLPSGAKLIVRDNFNHA